MDPNVSEITTLVEKGDLATASDLIRHFNQTAESLFPVLDVACRKGHTVMVRYLVNIGVPVDHANRDGIKPLHRAARRGDLEIVQCLIEHCENAHKNDYLNSCYMIPRITVWPFPYQWVFMSALAAAATEGHLEVVRYLVEQGADPLLKLQSNGLAVHCALRDDKDHVDVLRYLLDLNHSQLERKTADNETLLHLASRKDHVESARWLLDQGADHKAVDSEGDTPWLVATKARSAAVMGVFLGKEISSPQPLRGIWQRIGDKMKKATTYTYLFPGREQFYWGGNKLILAILDDTHCIEFLGLTRESYPNVSRQIERAFVEHKEPEGTLCVREATCAFETLADGSGSNFLSFAMPYMHSQKLEFLAMRRQRGLGKITDLEYCRTNDRKDLGADIEVTLDEFCNPALDPEVMRMRNVDQVLTRYGRRKISSMAPRSPHTDSLPLQLRLFTVPQLWCWKIGTKLIFSCAKSANEDLKLLRSEPKTIDPDQYIGRLISHFVDTLDRPQMLGLSEPIFSVFSKSIAAVAEDVNKYTRRASFDDISIRKETQFLHEINDIREEIAMIKTVLFQQEEVWKEFMVNTWPEYWPDGEDKRFRPPVCDDLAETEIWREIAKPQTQFPKFKKRFEKLDEDAERVERNILIKLDLKQKHATMKETHTATVMSAAVVGFTIITIIFAPLSFLTSLFALPIKQFRQEADGNYSSNYIGKWMATGEVASLIVTLLAIWVALECFLGLHITRRLRDLFPANDPRSMPEIDPYVRSAVGKLPKMPAPPRNSTKTEVYTPNEQPNHHSFRERVFWSRGRKAPSADVENGP